MIENSSSLTPMKSPLRWAGGKVQQASRLAAVARAASENRLYVEPFLGGASLFLSLRPRNALLNDLNEDLMGMYRAMRDYPHDLGLLLQEHFVQDSLPHYLAERELYKQDLPGTPAQGARFLYLNRVCFNGVFRVNSLGKYNVPYGRKPRPTFPGPNDVIEYSKVLAGADIRTGPFECLLDDIPPGSFVYLDPPYPPLSKTAYFTHYTAGRFGENDHASLLNFVHALNDKGCKILLSISDNENVRSNYSWMSFQEVTLSRVVSCLKEKLRVKELILRNFE